MAYFFKLLIKENSNMKEILSLLLVSGSFGMFLFIFFLFLFHFLRRLVALDLERGARVRFLPLDGRFVEERG